VFCQQHTDADVRQKEAVQQTKKNTSVRRTNTFQKVRSVSAYFVIHLNFLQPKCTIINQWQLSFSWCQQTISRELTTQGMSQPRVYLQLLWLTLHIGYNFHRARCSAKSKENGRKTRQRKRIEWNRRKEQTCDVPDEWYRRRSQSQCSSTQGCLWTLIWCDTSNSIFGFHLSQIAKK